MFSSNRLKYVKFLIKLQSLAMPKKTIWLKVIIIKVVKSSFNEENFN